ncbi:response regulator transcription factor [Aquimarina sp. TRL1]|uniref:LytR/AlgR family response regulator transcription factor n=1 Tax=Aquimarina sp. (strain TRL1) TaxID=2736252 RepID=UPI00158D1CFD|nr:LytTR family DNA-binding domain-containing protein [Aquimarina sp. TRL1]QKX05807.1 response regulator transcription factor [Aquimarina sp. TRL1]
MNVILIDDETSIREGLKILLSEEDMTIIGEAASIKEGISLIDERKPELVFLDIQLEDGNSFSLLEQLTFRDFKLVFITAYNQYAIKAFKYNALDYLLKPIDPEELHETLLRIKKQEEKNAMEAQLKRVQENKQLQNLTINTTQRMHVLPIEEIMYGQADQGYSTFFMKNGKKVVATKPLKEYAALLPEEVFIRVHQSYLVNQRYIKSYDREGILYLSNEEKIPVSVRKRVAVKKRLSQR